MRALGIGLDTARYGHHATFLREDKQLACPPMILMETRTGYEQLQTQIERLHQRFPKAQIYLTRLPRASVSIKNPWSATRVERVRMLACALAENTKELRV